MDLEYLKIHDRILNKVQTKMNWDRDIALIWWETPNPMLGGHSPHKLWCIGRGEKLEKVVDNLINGHIA